MTRKVRITTRLISRIHNKGKEIKCRKCKRELQEGDKAVSKIAGYANFHTVYYCVSCWKKIHI